MDKAQYEAAKNKASQYAKYASALSTVERAAQGIMSDGRVHVHGVDVLQLLSEEREAFWRVELVRMLSREAEIITNKMEAI